MRADLEAQFREKTITVEEAAALVRELEEGPGLCDSREKSIHL